MTRSRQLQQAGAAMNRSIYSAKDEINVPIALSAFTVLGTKNEYKNDAALFMLCSACEILQLTPRMGRSR